jgi:hypothetical protein
MLDFGKPLVREKLFDVMEGVFVIHATKIMKFCGGASEASAEKSAKQYNYLHSQNRTPY